MSQDLQAQFLMELEDRKKLAARLQEQANGIQPKEQVNLKPLMAFSDSMTGHKTSDSYTQPVDKNQEFKLKLQEQINKLQGSVGDDKIKLIEALRRADKDAESDEWKQKWFGLASRKTENSEDKAAADAAKAPKLSKDAYDAGGYARRLQQGEEVFSNLLTEGYQGPTRKDMGLSLLPKEVQGNNYRKYDQASRNFINATLRRESGASISTQEFANAEEQYLPKAGDTPDVLAQKKANRQQAFENFKTASQGAFEMTPYISPTKAVKKAIGTAAPGPATTVTVSNGTETMEIPIADLPSAKAEGFAEVK
jgi:hypothetical protein